MFELDLSTIPKSSGVYHFLDKKGTIIYVGKAKNLFNRVSSYFNNSSKHIKTLAMLQNAYGLKYIITNNEIEAFILEANIIKTEKPKYNILLKDSKSYPYIRLTKEEYPKLLRTRKVNVGDGEYFGPFIEASNLFKIIETLLISFPLRSCSDGEFRKGKACIKHQIKRCSAPCEGYVSYADYQKLVDEIRAFFNSKVDKVTDSLLEKEQFYAQNLDFERAAECKRRIDAIEKLFITQSVQIDPSVHADIFYQTMYKGVQAVTTTMVRSGRIIGIKTNIMEDEDAEELLQRYIEQFYTFSLQFAQTVAISYSKNIENVRIDDTLADMLSALANRKIKVKNSGFNNIFDLAEKNAISQIELHLAKTEAEANVLDGLQHILKLPCKLKLIECIDISHNYGDNVVGVSVVALNGSFHKPFYRKYKIKTQHNNDTGSIYEVMSRKIQNIIEGSEQQADLYIIDGGVSQLNSAIKATKDLEYPLNIVSISKGRTSVRNKLVERSSASSYVEEIHSPLYDESIKLRQSDPVMLFVQKIRNEAHRFAITFQRKSSTKQLITSPLSNVDGLGKKRLTQLLKQFPNVYELRNMSYEDLAIKTKFPIKLCENIITFINKEY